MQALHLVTDVGTVAARPIERVASALQVANEAIDGTRDRGLLGCGCGVVAVYGFGQTRTHRGDVTPERAVDLGRDPIARDA